jgi:DNA sulfur modification protein DndC
MLDTLSLFEDDAEIGLSTDERIDLAHRSIIRLFELETPVFVAYSGGKDSGVVSSIVLNAGREYFERTRIRPVVFVTVGDTRIENPEIVVHYQAELEKMRAYAKQHGIDLKVEVVRPSLCSTWQVKVLSGRCLPSYAGTNADCSISLKVQPQVSARNRLFRDLNRKKMREAVTCLGTRYDESVRRGVRMSKRGDSATEPVRNENGDLILCPIAYWGEDAVYEYLGLASSGLIESYSDFAETLRIYAHSFGTSCAVVASAIEAGMTSPKGKCSARHGCFLCLQATDRSLQNMIEPDDRYAYAKGLTRLNEFLRKIRWDWNRRHWLGRTIKGGYVKVAPDTFHSKTIREIFRYMLQLDYDEQVRSRGAGEDPKFCIIPLDILVAVDAMWSLNAMAPAFAAWSDFRDVYMEGIRYDIPDIPLTPETAMPEPRFLYVGDSWDATKHSAEWTGLRDPYIESLTEKSSCRPVLEDGEYGMRWMLGSEQQFSVDLESAYLLADFELEHMLATHDRAPHGSAAGVAYKFYVRYGTISVSHSQRNEHDEMLRRASLRVRVGADGDYDIGNLIEKSVSYAELPDMAVKAWKSYATSNSSQTEIKFF